MSRFLRARFLLLTAGAVVLVAGLTSPASAQESRASGSRDPRARWNSLSEADKDRYRKLFDELRRLPESERLRVKDRLKSLGEARVKLESNLSSADRAALDALDGEAREAWLRKATAELMRGRHDRMCGLVGEAKVKGVSGSDPKRRGQALAELSEEAARESVRRFTDYAVKRKVLTQEQAEELRALSIAEAAPRIASLKKDMVVNDVERKPELRAEVGESVWEEVKALPPEQFLQRIEAMRAFHKSVGRGHHGPPGGPQSSQGSRPSKGRPSRGGPPPNGTSQSNAEFEAKMREQARKVLKDQGLTDAEVEAKLAEGPIWKILRPSKSRGGRESWRGNDSKPSSRRGG